VTDRESATAEKGEESREDWSRVGEGKEGMGDLRVGSYLVREGTRDASQEGSGGEENVKTVGADGYRDLISSRSLAALE
jgi:hypothetical protein